MNLSYVRSPWSDVEYVCWCGALHGSEPRAAGCDHERRRVPVAPGPSTPAAADPVEVPRERIPDPRAPRLALMMITVWIIGMMMLLMVAANGDPGPGGPAPDTAPTTMVTPTSGP